MLPSVLSDIMLTYPRGLFECNHFAPGGGGVGGGIGVDVRTLEQHEETRGNVTHTGWHRQDHELTDPHRTDDSAADLSWTRAPSPGTATSALG